MDPNANLAEQLEISRRVLACETVVDVLAELDRLAELVEALNAWIVGGGFLPDAWKGKSNAR
jgi:hypothetical protein